VTFINMVGLILAIGAAGLALYSLIRPERF
jgi:hypothetical protein